MHKKSEDLIGRHCFEALHGKDEPLFGCPCGEICTTKKTTIKELSDPKSGKCTLASAYPILDANGELTGIVHIHKDITESKKAEEKLKMAANIFDLATDSIFVIDLAGNIIDFNEAAYKSRGFNKEEMAKMNIHDLDVPDFAALIESRNKMLLEKGSAVFESAHVCKDKTLLPIEIHARIVDLKGKKLIVAVARDISERKKAEEALRESEEKHRKLFEEALNAIFLADAKTGILIDCNPAASELVGREKSEIIGQHQRILHPQHEIEGDAARVFKQHQKQDGVLESQVITKTGEIKDVSIKANLIEISGQKVLQGVFRDVTERKKTEEQVKQLQEYLQLQVDRMPIGLIVWDREFRVKTWNPSAERIFGFTEQEAFGKHPYDLIVPKQAQPQVDIIWNRLIEGDVTANSANENLTKDGRVIFCDWSNTPLKKEDGTVIGVLSMAQDTTERKKAEEKLGKLMDELVMVNEKVGVVGKWARHDARNKLSVIKSNTYLAKKKLPSDHIALKYLDGIESACDMIVKIFDFASTYEMLGVEERSNVDVEKSVKEAVMLISDLNGVKVLNDCCGLTVLADSQLRQLFYNLIDNSLRHGEKVSRIRICYEDGKNELKLVYEDDGVGISDDVRSKLFWEGYGKGSGYGLYLTAKLCKMYGWTIQETSK